MTPFNSTMIAASAYGWEEFPYCPTYDFRDLHHNSRLDKNHTMRFTFRRTRKLDEGFVYIGFSADVRSLMIEINFKGGPITTLEKELTDSSNYSSILVPGLSGIPVREEFYSDAVVNRGIARGDANLYLRNVLLRIYDDDNLRSLFSKRLDTVYPGYRITTAFNPESDLWISAHAKSPEGTERSIDLEGTGLLQTVQLLAYVTRYAPKLLLLDEPDAHLHPNNQRVLAQVLHFIAQETSTQIILATHSRHLLDALSEYPDSKLFWIRDGKAHLQNDWSDVSVLMDLGALDRGERLIYGHYKYLLWTEDTDTRMMKTFLNANGFSLEEVFVFSYQASSKIDAAALMSHFVHRLHPGVRIIIHRDRDFMTDSELQNLSGKYKLENKSNVNLFITKYSDIEAYFAQPDHLAKVFGIDAQTMIAKIMSKYNNEFVLKFHEKRELVRRTLYRNNPDECPSTAGMMPKDQVGFDEALGKLLLAKISAELQASGKKPQDIYRVTDALRDPELEALK